MFVEQASARLQARDEWINKYDHEAELPNLRTYQGESTESLPERCLYELVLAQFTPHTSDLLERVITTVSAPPSIGVQSNYEAESVSQSADYAINTQIDRQPLVEAAHIESMKRSYPITKQEGVPVGYNNASKWFEGRVNGGGPGDPTRMMFLDAGLMLFVTVAASLVPR